jgi:hypothetical protein
LRTIQGIGEVAAVAILVGRHWGRTKYHGLATLGSTLWNASAHRANASLHRSGKPASASQIGWFGIEVLARAGNRAARADPSGQWIDRVHNSKPPKWITLDMDRGGARPTARGGHDLERAFRLHVLLPSNWQRVAVGVDVSMASTQPSNGLVRLLVLRDGSSEKTERKWLDGLSMRMLISPKSGSTLPSRPEICLARAG